MNRARRRTAVTAAALLLVAAAPLSAQPAADANPAAAQSPGPHPRLLVDEDGIAEIRDKVAAGGVHAAAWASLEAQAEQHLTYVNPEVVRANVGLEGGANGLEKPYALQNEMPTYLMDLGMAYQVSGNERYGQHAIDLMLALGDAGFPYWCCQDLGVGGLDTGLALAFDWTYDMMTSEERAEIIGDIARYEDLLLDRMLFNPTHPAARYATSNWQGVTAGGAGLLSLALTGEAGAPDRNDTYIAAAMDLVEEYLDAGWDPSVRRRQLHQLWRGRQGPTTRDLGRRHRRRRH